MTAKYSTFTFYEPNRAKRSQKLSVHRYNSEPPLPGIENNRLHYAECGCGRQKMKKHNIWFFRTPYPPDIRSWSQRYHFWAFQMTVLGIPPEAQLPTPKTKKVRVIRSSCAPSPYRPQIHKLMGIWSVLDGYRYKFAKLDVQNLLIFLRKVRL